MMWTDTMLELCRTLASQSCSAGQIAKAIGTKTRNAIIGKMYREGIPLLNKKKEKKVAVPERKRLMVSNGKFVPVKYADMPPQKIDVRREDGFAFKDLRDDQCRWPFGNDDYYFCGRPRVNGSPYCYHHEYFSHWHPR